MADRSVRCFSVSSVCRICLGRNRECELHTPIRCRVEVMSRLRNSFDRNKIQVASCSVDTPGGSPFSNLFFAPLGHRERPPFRTSNHLRRAQEATTRTLSARRRKSVTTCNSRRKNIIRYIMEFPLAVDQGVSRMILMPCSRVISGFQYLRMKSSGSFRIVCVASFFPSFANTCPGAIISATSLIFVHT